MKIQAKAKNTRNYLFLLTGSRRGGNSETLARRAAAALSDETGQSWLRLLDLPLPVFEDIRHSGDGTYPPPGANGQILLEATLAATDIVFVAPLYWYGLPAPGKLYLDHWSGWMRLPNVEFKERMAGKTMWAITAYSDVDPNMAAPLCGTLRLSAEYMKMAWGGFLLGYGNAPGDILQDQQALICADEFFARPPERHAEPVRMREAAFCP
jgi:multimeric flavodoxin WrbA